EDAAADDKRFAGEILAALPVGALLVFDLGFFSFLWFDDFTASHRFFVTRMREKIAYRRFPQGENDQHFWVFQRSSRVLEDHRKILQPGNRLARLVESGFPQDRVVAALVEGHDDPFRLCFEM